MFISASESGILRATFRSSAVCAGSSRIRRTSASFSATQAAMILSEIGEFVRRSSSSSRWTSICSTTLADSMAKLAVASVSKLPSSPTSMRLLPTSATAALSGTHVKRIEVQRAWMSCRDSKVGLSTGNGTYEMRESSLSRTVAADSKRDGRMVLGAAIRMTPLLSMCPLHNCRVVPTSSLSACSP